MLRKPEWLRRPPGSAGEGEHVKRLLREHKLNTVCEEARCPNIAECFSRGTATFMILGDVCTRGCRFCAVTTGKPTLAPADFQSEAARVADAAARLKLSHVVVTSVARDDLPDGGAAGFVATIHALREKLPASTVEVLVPDFRGNDASLNAVVDAHPDIFNHNVETVPRLYRRVRPGASYQRSLDLLAAVQRRDPSVKTKSGIMLGLGETEDEVLSVMRDAREHGINIFTAGQYMQPTREHLPVEAYVALEQFAAYQSAAEAMGFEHVFIGPLVRSSYHAAEQFGAVHTPETPSNAPGMHK